MELSSRIAGEKNVTKRMHEMLSNYWIFMCNTVNILNEKEWNVCVLARLIYFHHGNGKLHVQMLNWYLRSTTVLFLNIAVEEVEWYLISILLEIIDLIFNLKSVNNQSHITESYVASLVHMIPDWEWARTSVCCAGFFFFIFWLVDKMNLWSRVLNRMWMNQIYGY